MKSFSKQVKSEIVSVTRDRKSNKSELSALVQILGTVSLSNKKTTLLIKTENPDTARFVLKLLKDFYDVEVQMSYIQKVKLNKNKVYLIRVLNKAKEILEDLELLDNNGFTGHPSRSLTGTKPKAEAYLAGCFLAAGSVNDPKKSDYHLEIGVNKEELAEYILKTMKRLKLPAKMIQRRKQYVVYLKAVDYINDFLVYIGANECALAYADIKIRRDYYNSITRLDNCETANIVKSIQTGQKQLNAIDKLIESGKFDKLNDKLKEAAILRMENPEAPLSELSDLYYEKHGKELSKSGIKHRLEKLVDLAES